MENPVGAPASAASCVHVTTLPRGSRCSTSRTRAGCSDSSGAKQPVSSRTSSPTATLPAESTVVSSPRDARRFHARLSSFNGTPADSAPLEHGSHGKVTRSAAPAAPSRSTPPDCGGHIVAASSHSIQMFCVHVRGTARM